MRRELLAAMKFETDARRASVLVTDVADGAQFLLLASSEPKNSVEVAARQALLDGESRMALVEGREYFFTVAWPAPRLVIVGASHVSQALAALSVTAGFDVAIVDPRKAFASERRFPGVNLVAQWPQDAFKQAPLDPFCAVALLAHVPSIDDPALLEALDAGCFYIGALGSKKTRDARMKRLAAAGRQSEADRIHAPIGLDIGARTPAEIAVAILAEIVSVMRRGGARRR